MVNRGTHATGGTFIELRLDENRLILDPNNVLRRPGTTGGEARTRARGSSAHRAWAAIDRVGDYPRIPSGRQLLRLARDKSRGSRPEKPTGKADEPEPMDEANGTMDEGDAMPDCLDTATEEREDANE